MESGTRGERVAAALATIAANTTQLRKDFDEHRGEVKQGLATVDTRLKALEGLKSERDGATRERRRLATLGRAAASAVGALLSIDLVHRYAQAYGQLLPGWFK